MLTNAPARRSDSQAQHLLEMIESGELNVGDRLPGQRELAEKLNVGRSTVREAIRSLEALGLLETRFGLGTYVVRATPFPLENSLNAWLAENKGKVIKIFEVREALESKAAGLAAVNAGSEEIRLLKDALLAMATAISENDQVRIAELDYQFHDVIGHAASNEVLYQMIENICSVLAVSRNAVLALPGRAARSLQEHWKIAEAIEAADADGAREAMIRHITNAVADIQ
jgi:GntR family transcriptional repressor for pyruvate dehydrogenase complex